MDERNQTFLEYIQQQQMSKIELERNAIEIKDREDTLKEKFKRI